MEVKANEKGFPTRRRLILRLLLTFEQVAQTKLIFVQS
jgi:hypothetical protein